jgi:signal transduction histidine kinase
MINPPRPSPRLAHIREAVEHHREELVLVHAVSVAANELTSLSAVLGEVLQMTCEHMGWPVGHAFGVVDLWYLQNPDLHGALRATTETTTRDAARQLGLDHHHTIPILARSEVVAVLEFFAASADLQTPARPAALLSNIATVLGHVAERVQHASEQQRLASELRRRNRELEQFASVASHDLRAPLRGIGNLASWIARDLEPHLTDHTRHYLELLEARVSRMEGLISGLLEYSRVGRHALPDEHIDVGMLVREIIDLLEAGSGVEWHIARLPRVRGPRVLLRQVFHNLLANAVQHSVVPRLRIEVAAAREATGVWRFSVRDNGPGIAACHQTRIWEIFQTLQPRDDVESTGIGLSLVRKIVEQRGGEVGVESTLGQGACFFFSWPETMPEPVSERAPKRAREHASE